MLIRIDKYLADAGLGTRSAVQELLRKGRVRVNGETVKDGKLKIDPDTAEVTMDGKPVCYEEYSYYILNKPAGILSASRDKKEKTVIDIIPQPRPRELFPVGRLDKDTEGLLLLTNDGPLCHRLTSPRQQVEKEYFADFMLSPLSTMPHRLPPARWIVSMAAPSSSVVVLPDFATTTMPST